MATIAPRRQEDAALVGKKNKAAPVVNFSRLRRRRDAGRSDSDEKEVVVHEQTRPSDVQTPDLEELIHAAYNDDRNVHSINAFYKSDQPENLPDEPCFSIDSLSTIASVAELPDTSLRIDSQTLPLEPVSFTDDSPTSSHILELPDTSKSTRIERGSISELPVSSPSTRSSSETKFRWDDRATPAKTPPLQPNSSPIIPLKSILRKLPTRITTPSRPSTADTITPPSTSSSTPNPLKSILKHTTVDQYSETASSSSSSAVGEDDRSHHTVSESSTQRNGSVDSNGKWSSSDYDTSQLSEKEVRKLEKKGINPALYLEMRAARGGKKGFGGLMGGLTGNAYVS